MNPRNIVLIFALLAIPFTSGCGRGGFLVHTGNVALVINQYNGHVDPHIRHAGWNAQGVFSGNEIVEIPTYTRTYTMVKEGGEGAHTGDDSVFVNTANQNSLRVDCSISYYIKYDPKNPGEIIDLFQKYRTQFADNYDNFEEVQLRPAFRQAITDAFGAQNTSVSMTGDGKRAAAQYAKDHLNIRFNPDAIVIKDVRIRAIYPDATTVSALASNLTAQQNLRLATLNLQLNALQNQKSILATTANAQAVRIRAASLTPQLVKFRHMKDISFVGVPSGAIINVAPPAAQ